MLITLIHVAAVANLNLSVANVALPEIGKAFDASQTALNLTAVAYSLGLAASVLWFGALGDRHGRKMMCVGCVILSIPARILAACAPTIGVPTHVAVSTSAPSDADLAGSPPDCENLASLCPPSPAAVLIHTG